MIQKILSPEDNYRELDDWIRDKKYKKILLVCDESLRYQKKLYTYLNNLKYIGINIISFSRFKSNPLYENVQEGVNLFRCEKCDSIIAIGGGSAIDVAKCIKLYANLPGDGNSGSWLQEKYVSNEAPLLAIPTTAGTGSESTRYAVIYYNGVKQSVTSDSIIPSAVLLDPDTLMTLPVYQKKATMCDALCHAIESFWSVNSTEESKRYSKEAIILILAYMEDYLANTDNGRKNMLLASNLAGKAINISQTTAGHAMCYKITSLFGIAHGHAAILCDRILFPWLLDNVDKCIDKRRTSYLECVLGELAASFGCNSPKDAAIKLQNIFTKLELEVPKATEYEYSQLVDSVNSDRLQNFPVLLDVSTISMLYHNILH